MKEGPDIALVASLIGDPARANMLSALLAGKALTATELAAEAGITAQTASSHLKKLEFAQLIAVRKQGRHKYFVLADDEVGHALEALMGLAARRGLLRTRTGPKDPSLRKARICYNHLAGDLAVKLYEGLLAKNYLSETSNGIELTNAGHSEFVQFGINMETLVHSKRPLCLSCLDWSERRTHLAGGLGSALLQRFYELGWAKRVDGSRAIQFSKTGEQRLNKRFSL